ncbi:DUF1080 domain-containing protein [soil metagenome]
MISSFCFSSCNTPGKISKIDDSKKWTSLFNGMDLRHWIPKIAGYPVGENFGNTFRVEDGILSTRYNQYDSFRQRFGSLFYDHKFRNFRLKVEYRFVGDTAPGAPSWGFRDGGIQYMCQSPSSMKADQPFPVCLEYNLLGGDGKNERPTGEICCSGMYVQINGERNNSYCNSPFVKKTFSGDQWVTAEIEVKNGTIRHFVNGEEILVFENPRYDTSNLNVKHLELKADVSSGGFISLQSNSHPMDFRKIEILELP